MWSLLRDDCDVVSPRVVKDGGVKPRRSQTIVMNESLGRVTTKLKGLTTERQGLPRLQAWMDKEKSKHKGRFHHRWVVLEEGFLMWAPNKQDEWPTSVLKGDEHDHDGGDDGKKGAVLSKAHSSIRRLDFGNWLYLMHLKSVRKLSENKLEVVCEEVGREGTSQQSHVFRTDTEEECDEWVNAIEQHSASLLHMVDYLNYQQSCIV